MKRPPLPEDESWESDAVWKLLDAAPPASAGPRFADDVLRAVKLAEPAKPWWKRLFGSEEGIEGWWREEGMDTN